ncbi:MAG: S1 RNA-binding domain-containing protein [bacterium]|nr:S1 RNA-binding domain-containing protein [bacterium]
MIRDNDDSEDFAAALAEFEQEQAATPRREPRIGDKASGKIVAIGDEVAFVDLGAKAEGIVRLVELCDEDGKLAAAVDDTVEALIAATDPETGCFVLRVKPGRAEAAHSELRQAWEHRIPVEAMVQATTKGGVEVEVAGFRAFCPVSQLEMRYVEDPAEYVGRRLTFRITRFEEASRGRGPNIVLSRRVLLEEEAKARAAETLAGLEVGKVVQGTVTSLTNYGAFVDLGGLEGLLHISEMGHGRLEHPSEVLAAGQLVDVQITSIEPGKEDGSSERISLSRRALEQDPWDLVATHFPEGSMVDGRVVRVKQFGAFVELEPGIDGLIHVSELGAGKRINHAREVVKVGETVRVKVLKIEAEKRRISLSRAAPEDEVEASAAYGNYDQDTVQAEGFGAMGHYFKSAKKKR